MADLTLLSLVAQRLAALPPKDGCSQLIVAAFNGAEALDDAVDHGAPQLAKVTSAPAGNLPAAVYLTALEVEGFRGIGPPATVDIAPGPGLTLVLGRNGSGKSSFSEALEMLLAGSNQRWAERSKVWSEGWQNLHHRNTRITATFAVDGRRTPLRLTRQWAENSALEDSAVLIDGKPGSIDQLGWSEPLAGYPPLLSHNELEHSLDAGPSKLYDALAAILGLGEIVDATAALRVKRLSFEHLEREAGDELARLRPKLEASEDERAAKALLALSGKKWDLDALERLATGAPASDERSTLMRLRGVAALPVLDSIALNDAIEELRAAASDLERRSGTDAGAAHETAQLLEQALVVHSHASDQNCPVCGSKDVLSFEWRRQAGERIAQLKTEAAEYDKARSRVSHAIRTARQLVTAIPSALRDAQGMQLDTEPVIEQWRVWAQLPDGEDPVRLASHLETHGAALGRSIAALRKQANAELERRESSWRPTAQAISEWLALARRAQAGAPKAKQLKDAEHWLRDAYDELRDERFRPIADAVQLNWTELRQDSNVSLGELRLEGAAARRRLALDVRVDGEPGSALGVMSQGELNCLALSLFLPRASMPESPFHFLVIDDPVQAMDPSKVEGLAMVLARTAKTRQVVVLTHDDRLADVMRFLNIEATVIEVVRRENSSVATQLIRDPVQRYIDDARAIALTEDLPAEAARVIPGFCRLALEAAAALAVTRRMLREGKPYDDVHTALAQPTTLNMWLALALLKDASRAGDVASYLQREHPIAVDAVRDVNKGAHGGSVLRDPRGLINVVEKLTTVILDKN